MLKICVTCGCILPHVSSETQAMCRALSFRREPPWFADAEEVEAFDDLYERELKAARSAACPS